MEANTKKFLKICCLITTVLLVLIILTVVILYFTMLKPKQPVVAATSVTLKRFDVGFFPVIPYLQITLSADVCIKNKNYAGFKYQNTSISLFYKGFLVGEAPISAGEIKARQTQNINTVLNIEATKVLLNPDFPKDWAAGTLEFTSDSTMVGDVILLKFFKLHATTKVHCDIKVFATSKNSTADCVSSVKF